MVCWIQQWQCWTTPFHTCLLCLWTLTTYKKDNAHRQSSVVSLQHVTCNLFFTVLFTLSQSFPVSGIKFQAFIMPKTHTVFLNIWSCRLALLFHRNCCFHCMETVTACSSKTLVPLKMFPKHIFPPSKHFSATAGTNYLHSFTYIIKGR